MGYIGIDYGLGQSNIDAATGIRFGVISRNSIMPEAFDDIENVYAKGCPKCGGDVVEATVEFMDAHDEWDNYEERGGCRDYACESCEMFLDNDSVWGEEPIGLEYERDGYKLTNCLDSDLFILKSLFCTNAQFCSPCVPGAGNLDNPVEGGPKTYCLGHDWFAGGIAPYPVFRVSDGKKIVATQETVNCEYCEGTNRRSIGQLAKAREQTLEAVREEAKSGKAFYGDYRESDDTVRCWCCANGKAEKIVEREE